MTFWSNTGEGLRRQPDNYYGLKVFCFVLIIYTVLQWVTGLRSLLIFCPIYLFCQYTNNQAQAGHIEVSDKSGMTVEGLQEYYDEACLAIMNNKLVLKKHSSLDILVTGKEVVVLEHY